MDANRRPQLSKYERNVLIHQDRIKRLLVRSFDLVGVSRAGDIKGKVNVQGIKSAENIAVYIDVFPEKSLMLPPNTSSSTRKE